MSKMDLAHGSRQILEATKELSEEDTMEMRLHLLSQQEMQKLKSNAELLKTLKDLHTLIRDATAGVQRAAHEVRAYPVEAVTQATVRIEQSIKTCEKSAERAQEVYDSAKKTVLRTETNFIWWVVAASFFAAMMTTMPLIFFLR